MEVATVNSPIWGQSYGWIYLQNVIFFFRSVTKYMKKSEVTPPLSDPQLHIQLDLI